MGQTLRIASSTGAYTLTDRGTYEALHSSTSLAVVHEGDTRLLNTYAVIADPGNARGMRFARWLAEGAGLDVMTRELERNEVRGFSIWPRGRERSSPEATPR
jgi:tungstate transport system substrate-binding protein